MDLLCFPDTPKAFEATRMLPLCVSAPMPQSVGALSFHQTEDRAMASMRKEIFGHKENADAGRQRRREIPDPPKPDPQPLKKPDEEGQSPSPDPREDETGPSKSSGVGPRTIDPDNE